MFLERFRFDWHLLLGKIGKGNVPRIAWASIATVSLVIAVLLGSSLFQRGVSSAAAKEQINATETALASKATKYADTIGTATAIANPYPSYLPGKGTLALYEPLSQSTSSWVTGSDNETSCQFTEGAYHIVESKLGWFYNCGPLISDFANFAFEVQMNIVKGDCGGMLFRYKYNKFYYFGICQDGYYSLYLYMDGTADNAKKMKADFTPAFRQGTNQTNLIAVAATGNTITLYVNQQQVTTVQDSTYTHGKIGLFAYDYRDPTEVAYTNAKVWTLL